MLSSAVTGKQRGVEMAKVTFTIDVDDGRMAIFDELASLKGQDRDGMIGQLVAEFVQFESASDEYDAWFREQMEEALRESLKPGATVFSHEDVMRDWRQQRVRLVGRAVGKAG